MILDINGAYIKTDSIIVSPVKIDTNPFGRSAYYIEVFIVGFPKSAIPKKKFDTMDEAEIYRNNIIAQLPTISEG